MKLRIILINPWIYDFSAVNLWSRPLGLLKVSEYLSQFNVELSLIDCMDTFRLKKYGKGNYPKEPVKKPECLKSIPRRFGRYGMDIDNFRKTLVENAPFDIIFVTSIMSYWYPGVQKVIEIIKNYSINLPVILGGIYATLWHDHASETSGADFIYNGQISENIKFALNTFGFRLKKKSKSIPLSQPFVNGSVRAHEGYAPLQGWGDSPVKFTPYYKLGLYDYHPFAPVLTSFGCPYRCSYCGSNLLNNGFVQRKPHSAVKEIKELYSTGIRDFAFYDDALFINAKSHIKVILKELIESGLNIRFHCPNGLHARFIDDELVRLMKDSGFKTLRLSLETIDSNRQRQTGGKVTSDDLFQAVKNLKRHGFKKKDIGVYLMYGLPGQGLDEVKEGVKFLKSMDVRINLTEFSPIPGTECWDELVAGGVISDDIDPLLTNNTVFSYLFSGYDPEELERLKLEVKNYNMKPSVL